MRREGNSGQEQEGGWELPSIKELYFNLKGKEFLAQSGYTEFYEQTEKLPCFGEILRSRQTAIRQLNLGTPKGLKTDTITEQEQLELFFMELRHGHLGLVLEKYSPLIKKYSSDPVFDTAMGQTIEHRSTPNDAGQSLSFYVLVAWIHGFLWGLKHEDRADALARVYGDAVFADMLIGTDLPVGPSD